jgi:enamine deaminase RidA (YjgF/YER057c/UK114 family)
MSGTAVLELDYVAMDQIAGRPVGWWSDVLGVVGYSRPPRIDAEEVPVTASMTPSLDDAAGTLCEVWRVAGAADSGLSSGRGRIHHRYSNDFLFGTVTLREQTASGPDARSRALSQATISAYRDIFELLEKTGHRHLIRVWNYLPEINREVDGDERYRHFNAARQSAFRGAGRPTEVTVPAACALGSPLGSPICIYFIAAREPPTLIENPRQTSAYRYPPKFGSHSPSFSRACMLGGVSGTSLFISGTASIVGHETIHLGDVAAQTRETLANLGALLEEANRVAGAPRYSLDALKMKVYVRRPHDLEAIRSVLSASVRPVAPILFLQADVCRQELLVEIEATGATPPA